MSDETENFVQPVGCSEVQNQSETIEKLAEALSIAQGQMSGAKKSAENPFFKSSYADLYSCWETAREPLSKNGLSVIQTTKLTDDGVIVVTTLAHKSGQWIRGELKMKSEKAGPQAVGSILTYARRYGFCGIVGIAPTDDDGEGAENRENVKQEKQFKKEMKRNTKIEKQDNQEDIPLVETRNDGKSPDPAMINAAQKKLFHVRVKAAGMSVDESKVWLKGLYQYESTNEIPKEFFNDIIGELDILKESQTA